MLYLYLSLPLWMDLVFMLGTHFKAKKHGYRKKFNGYRLSMISVFQLLSFLWINFAFLGEFSSLAKDTVYAPYENHYNVIVVLNSILLIAVLIPLAHNLAVKKVK